MSCVCMYVCMYERVCMCIYIYIERERKIDVYIYIYILYIYIYICFPEQIEEVGGILLK